MAPEMVVNLVSTFLLKAVMAVMRSAVDGVDSVHEEAAHELASVSSVANFPTASPVPLSSSVIMSSFPPPLLFFLFVVYLCCTLARFQMKLSREIYVLNKSLAEPVRNTATP